MSEFRVHTTLIDENAHPCVFAGMGFVEPEVAIALGAAMIGAGQQAARMDGRNISMWKLWRMAFRNYTSGLALAPMRQPENEWKERQR